MKKTTFVLTALLCAASTSFAADNFGTAADAEALVGKLVKAVAANHAAAYKEVTAKDPKWVHGDLYPLVIDLKGVMLSHGADEKLIGKEQYDLHDIDGKAFVKGYIEATKAKGKSWTDYKYTDPVTKKALPKSLYCEKVSLKSGDVVACAGIYKR
jgi:signal transduction histidine kinase